MQDTKADNDLMIDVQSGNVQSFQILAERWQHRIFGHCLQLLSNRALAEEATQARIGKEFFELLLWLLVEKILNPIFDNLDKDLNKEFNISSSVPSNLKNGR